MLGSNNLISFAAVVGLSLTLGGGCVTMLPIKALVPGAVGVGSTNQLTILHTEGRRSAREVVIQEIEAQSRSRGYFTTTDKSEAGIEVKIAGRSVTIDGAEGPVLVGGELGIRIDVIDWDASEDTVTRKQKDKDGNDIEVQVPVLMGEVLLGITLFDAAGNAKLAETEYSGKFVAPANGSKDAATDGAAKNAVSKFLNDITPRSVIFDVRLDTKDKAQKAIVKTAKGGAIGQARKDMEAYYAANPENAIAAYNLALYTDAMGDYGEALVLYDKAISMSTTAYYGDARASCAKRKAAAEQLAN